METDLLKKNNSEQLRLNIQKFQSDFLKKFSTELDSLVEGLVSEIDQSPPPLKNGNVPNYSNSKNEKPLEKVFSHRNSVLTELLKISHIQTIYNIFVAVMMILFINTTLNDLIETGSINLDFSMIRYAFGKSHIVLSVWVVMQLSLISLFPLFHFWAHSRITIRKIKKTYYDVCALVCYISYLGLFFYLPIKIILVEDIPIVSTMIILCEQIRMIMKSYAFVRENAPRALSFKPHQDDDTESSPCPNFSNFLYFLFVPTLIYRDQYPRTPAVRWSYVVTNFVQVFACLFYLYYIFQRFLVPVFNKFGQEPPTLRLLMLSTFGSMLPAILVFLISFFAILHSWMNAFAEMLTFGDRLFYKDWWNSTSYSQYYRCWNIVVHDWLFSYVYKDVYKLLGNKLLATYIVFITSAVVHEYIIAFSFKFFYPVLFFLFAIVGVIFVMISNQGKGRSWNVFMWATLIIGNGLLMSLYCMEWYARLNCPLISESFTDYLIPRSWFCSQ